MKTLRFFILVAIAASFASESYAYDFALTYEGKELYFNITYEGDRDDIHNNEFDPYGQPYDNEITSRRPSATCELTYKSVELKDGELVYNSDNQLSGIVFSPLVVVSEGRRYCVTKIGEHAFENCDKITRFCQRMLISYVGKCAFKDCKNLALVNSVVGGTDPKDNYLDDKCFRDSVFYGCTSLTGFSFGQGQSFEKDAFRGCTAIDTLVANNDPRSSVVAEGAFSDLTNGNEKTCTLVVKTTIKEKGYWAKELKNSYPWNQFNIVEYYMWGTGVDDVTVAPEKNDGAVYNINGQVVRQPGESTDGLPCGIYIKDGKKIVK